MMFNKSVILLLFASAALARSPREICAAEGSDSTLVPAKNCNKFFICNQGVPLELNCQPGLVFNVNGYCDWPENVDCKDRTPIAPEEKPEIPELKPVVPEEKPEIPEQKPEVPEQYPEATFVCAVEGSDGVLIPAENCAQFIKCSGGIPAVLDCQPGLLYNPAGWCDWPENVNCDGRSGVPVPEEIPAKSEEKAEIPEKEPAIPEQKPEISEQNSEASAICAAEESDGVLLPAQNCAQFIKCSEGFPAVLECQPGLLYNPAGWCDWPENVDCSGRSVGIENLAYLNQGPI